MASTTGAAPRGRRSEWLPQLGMAQWLALLVVLAGMALAGNFAFRRIVGDGETTEVGVQTGTVSRRTIESTVSASGTVAATRQVRITPSAAGQIQEVLVKQGDRVEEGQTLATLNAFNLEVKRDQARSTLQTAQYRLEALLAGPTNSDVATAQQSVATAQSSLTRSQNDLFNLLAGPSADDVAAARASVERSSANLQAAQSNYDKLVNRTDLTLRPEYASLQAARSSYQTALSNYVNRTAPPNPLDVSNAQASVTSAQASLDSARTRLVEVLRGADPLDVANAQNQVTSAQAALDAARARLNEVQNPTLASVDLGPLQASVESARASLQAARARLAQVMQSQASAEAAAGAASRPSQQSGSGPSDIASAEAAVRAAESSLALAESNVRKATEVPAPNSTDVLVAQQSVTQAETTYRNAVNNLQKLLQGPAADQVATAQQAVTSAEGLLQTARNNLEKLLAGPAAEDVAAAKASLDTAQSNLETAQANWDRLTSLADLESRPEYTQLMTARADYQTALSTYNTRTAGPKDTDVATAQAAVDAANSTLNSSLARLAQVLGGALPTDIGVAREAVATAELAVKQAQNDLDNAVLRAPFRGTVVSVGVNPGDQVGASTAAFSLLDPELIRVDASVDESNVIKLKPGMAVNVSFDALQGRQFAGVVATVTPAGVTQQGVVTFPVTVVFNGQGFTIPPGTTATLRVVTESKPSVLVVPSRAVVRQNRQTFVNVLVDGKQELRPVRTGITADNVTEILEGLQEGETIVISAPQQGGGQTGTFGAGGLPGLGTGAPGAPAAPAPQPARR